jgi:hypothetical protein
VWKSVVVTDDVWPHLPFDHLHEPVAGVVDCAHAAFAELFVYLITIANKKA